MKFAIMDTNQDTNVFIQTANCDQLIMVKPYYKKQSFTLYCDNSLTLLAKIKEESVDMIFADPPYFLSKGEKRDLYYPLKKLIPYNLQSVILACSFLTFNLGCYKIWNGSFSL